jgi:hypothetical protein
MSTPAARIPSARDLVPREDPNEMWERLVADGMSEEEATQRVSAVHGPPRSYTDEATTTTMPPSAPAGGRSPEGPGPVQRMLTRAAGVLPAFLPPGMPHPRTALAMAHGATLGYSDELLGTAAGALTGIGGERGRELARAELERMPWYERWPAEIAGGVGAGYLAGAALGPVVGATRLAPWVGRVPWLTRAVAGGAAGGAVGGAGETEGSLRERLPGAAAGGVFGAVLPVGFAGAGKVARGVRGLVRSGLDVAGLTPDVTPTSTLARWLLPQSAEERAQQVAARALERGGETAEQLAGRAAENPDYMLIDVGGQGTQRLGRAVGTVPSRGSQQLREALTQRQEGQSARLGAAIESRTGLRRGDLPALTEDIAREQAEAARPLYERAYQVDIKDPRILDVLDTPQFAAAYNRGRRIAALEGIDLPNPFKTVEGKRVLDRNITVPVQAIDYMKRGMDDLIFSRSAGGKMARGEARALRQKLNSVLAMTDELVPEYGLARGVWAGGEREKEAAEFGTRLFGGGTTAPTPTQARRTLAAMSEGEKLAARRAAVDQVLLRLERAGDTHDATRKIAGNPLLRQRLDLLFDSKQQRDALVRDIQQERLMGSSFNLFRGGSNTADKIQDVLDLTGVNIGDLIETGGSPTALLARSLLSSERPLRQGVNERVANALAPLLTAQGPELERLLGQLDLTRQQQAQWAEAIRRAQAGATQTAARQTAGGLQGSR